ncbi:MAG: agmatinase family protein, partial [Bacteroidota bacterium]
MSFDPNGVGRKGSLFGFPYSEKEADLVILPMPWDVTVSYGDGTSWGPAAILDASLQLDFSISGIASPWTYPLALSRIESEWAEWSERLRRDARLVIEALEEGIVPDQAAMDRVNEGCKQMVAHVRHLASAHLADGKTVALLGGDHSTSLGLMQAIGGKGSFGILQIDAHMDLRRAYEGFVYSHASVMTHAMEIAGVSSLTQVGIRDYCQEEQQVVEESQKPIHVFYDDDINEGLFLNRNWSEIVGDIVDTLPEQVYISLDIDGLDPALCPNTGTPVPGGLSFGQLDFLLRSVVRSGRKIVGFDLCEVSPGVGDWDANVGARVLYRLA